MAELEAMKDALVPYMNDYGIFSLDADEIPNKVRIEVYERSPALEQLLENDADSYEIVEVGDITGRRPAPASRRTSGYGWHRERDRIAGRVRAVRCPERLNRKTGCGP